MPRPNLVLLPPLPMRMKPVPHSAFSERSERVQKGQRVCKRPKLVWRDWCMCSKVGAGAARSPRVQLRRSVWSEVEQNISTTGSTARRLEPSIRVDMLHETLIVNT